MVVILHHVYEHQKNGAGGAAVSAFRFSSRHEKGIRDADIAHSALVRNSLRKSRRNSSPVAFPGYVVLLPPCVSFAVLNTLFWANCQFDWSSVACDSGISGVNVDVTGLGGVTC